MKTKLIYIVFGLFLIGGFFITSISKVDAQACSASCGSCGGQLTSSCGGASDCRVVEVGGGMCQTWCDCTVTQQGSTLTQCTSNPLQCEFNGGFCQYDSYQGSFPNGTSYPCDPPDNNGGASTDYNLIVSPSTRSIVNGETTTFTTTITPVSLMDGVPVTLSISGCPSGATCSFVGGNTVTMANPAVTVNKTLTVTSTAVAQNIYTITINATGNSVTRSTTAALSVNSGQNNSLCLFITAPDTLAPGEQFQFSARFRNTGTKTWAYPSPGVGHRLGSWAPKDVDTWGPWTARTDMGGGVTVAPNGEITFTRTLTAPSTPGTYAFQFAMLEEGVEWMIAPGSVCVKPGGVTVQATPAPNSQCLAFDIVDGSGNILSNVTPGQSVFSRVRLRNTGNTTWMPFNGNPDAMSLAITPWAASPWNYSRGTFASNVVPGDLVTITTPITAPNTPGTYAMSYQLYKENQGWIGQTCTKSGGVTVVAPLAVNITPSATSVSVGQQINFTINATSGSGLDSVGLESLTSTGVPVNNLGENAVTGNSTSRVFSWTPSSAGTYYFGGYAWSAGRASLLRTTPPVVVTVSNSVPANASQCTSISLTDTSGNPITSVTTNQAFRALVNMRNTGTNTWTPSGANNYHITTLPWNASNPWNYARSIIGTTVATNGQHTFTINLTAPSTAGTYPLQTQMLQEGVAWFGETCDFSTLVGGGGVVVSAPTNNAQCVSVSAPTSVVAGSTFAGTITMRNTGTKPWTAAFTPPNGQGHKLGSSNPRSNAVWGSNSVRMTIPNGTTINQNQTYAFNTTFTAPSVAGTYPFSFEMLEEAVQWFGNLCSPSTNSGNINVTAAPITQYTLTVNKTIGGSVTSTDGLVSCGSNCVRQYNEGTVVTLQAVPDTVQWRFAGWSGACSGTGNCVVTVNGNTTVTAQFRPRALQYQEF